VYIVGVLQTEQVWDPRSAGIHVEFRINYEYAASTKYQLERYDL
jgi:hypothetical protein